MNATYAGIIVVVGALALGAMAGGAAGRGAARSSAPAAWVRPSAADNRPIWGHRRGIQVALYPVDVEGPGDGGPRGLLRICYPMLRGGAAVGLVNYIAVEPEVGGRRGFSEMETGADGIQGRPFRTGRPGSAAPTPDRGVVTRSGRVERLTVSLEVERFADGAHPYVDMEFRTDRPDEVRFTVCAAPDSAPMDCCVLTATMGNYARLRRLWLSDGVATPASLWPGFAGQGFTSSRNFGPDRLPRTRAGDALVCAQTDEPDPSSAPEQRGAEGWAYRGSFTLTQYWRKPMASRSPGLQARVNGRRFYWGTDVALPGGLAFENFDLVEPFHEGQQFVFGLTRKSPQELGVRVRQPAPSYRP